MDCFNIAILILIAVILVYVYPKTRSCVAGNAPWLAIAGGALAVGLLLSASGQCSAGGGFSGGAEKKLKSGRAAPAPKKAGPRSRGRVGAAGFGGYDGLGDGYGGLGDDGGDGLGPVDSGDFGGDYFGDDGEGPGYRDDEFDGAGESKSASILSHVVKKE